MDGFEQISGIIALTMGVAWASGINLYAAMLMLGLMGLNGTVQLPPDLQVLAHPWVIGAAGLMYLVEFVTDKIPGLDTLWDSLHTFIRIPAGAILAAGAVGQVDPAMITAAAILGGTVSAGTHVVKAGSRAMVNTSPEPVSNWTLSISEDLAVIVGIWAAVQHPWVFLACFLLFMLAATWLIPRIWRAIMVLVFQLKSILGAGRSR
jgi:hypothetical protein